MLNRRIEEIVEKDLPRINSQLEDMEQQLLLKSDETYVDNLANSKRDKTVNIEMADLSQAVKSAMTGGSVAVVGVDSVDTINLKNNVVNSAKAKPSIQNLTVGGKYNINFDFVNNKIIVPSTYNIMVGKNSITVLSGQISMGVASGFWIILDTATRGIVIDRMPTDEDVVLGAVWKNGSSNVINFAGEYLVNGEYPYFNAIKKERVKDNCIVYSDTSINFDFINNIVTFPKTIVIAIGNDRATITNHENITIPSNSAGWIYFNFITNKIVLTDTLAVDGVLLGWWNNGSVKRVEMNAFVNYDIKTITFLGDSITEGVGTTKTYHSLIKNETGWNVNNMGLAGSCVSSFKTGIALPFVTRCNSVPSNSDLIVVFGGTNDYGNDVPLGNINSTDPKTFYGAYKSVLNTFLYNYPNSKVLCVTPMRRNDGKGGNISNLAGHKLIDYVNSIKEVCFSLGIPIVDLYNDGNMNIDVEPLKTLFTDDGLHPNIKGHTRFYNSILSKLKNI